MMRVKPKLKSQWTKGSRDVRHVPEKVVGQVESMCKKGHIGCEGQITDYRDGKATWAQIMHPVL